MTPHHHDHMAAAAISPLPMRPALRPALRQAVRPGVRLAVRRVAGLVTIPAVLMISGEVGAP